MSILTMKNGNLVPMAPSILYGTTEPENSLGMNGDLYFTVKELPTEKTVTITTEEPAISSAEVTITLKSYSETKNMIDGTTSFIVRKPGTYTITCEGASNTLEVTNDITNYEISIINENEEYIIIVPESSTTTEN